MQSYPSPDAFVEAQDGWRRPVVEALRAAILAGAPFAQSIKWGNLTFHSGGFCVLIHVEDRRVMLGFLRGKRLVETEPRIKPSGKYELGNWTFFEGDALETEQVTRLAARAAELNAELGDPTAITR
ncbi:MAG: DUF1801 domain-containing protein [Sphingobium sp.]|nr:DUF1801 domain-containing protein [Sphingobium sp.]